ncbi:type VII secretion protein EccE [Actinoplanes sp. TFC3]|uniref:type VII secretion protein EccE n=1 Tax=Actinoplanes sp. TFC3 TaxID=1710355 RepID=UPI000B1B2276|nr:type VII secretion protein EccE [Actinoplanes sp. TFC3]
MTAQVATGRSFPELSGAGQQLPKLPRQRVRHGRVFGIRTGQLVSTQIALAVALIGAINGPIALGAGAFVALIILVVTWLHLRGRWAFEWFGTALRYSRRNHLVSVDSAPTALLGFVAPGSRVEQTELAGDPAAIIVDGQGYTAVLELGDPTGLLAEDITTIPSPASLLPPTATEHPPCRIQILLTGAPAPSLRAGGGTPANSYRQLSEGRLLGYSRAFLAVRVLRGEGWSEDDLRRALSGLVRKLLRRLTPTPARPLGETAALRVIAELAHDDGVGAAQESWPGLQVGGMTQATFRLNRWPDLRIETSRRLIARMLGLPAAATTVALGAGPRASSGTSTAVDLTVRLAAPDATTLSTATQALRKLLANERATARRLDGEHLEGLTATLPLGIPATAAIPGRAGETGVHESDLNDLYLPIGNAGLMVGQNRHKEPVIARLFRPEQTRALLVGGVRCAQLLALRAMALGARVVVQTARPQAWEPFVRGAAVPGESIAVIPPGRAVEIPPGSALHPLLVIVDIGPVGADNRPGAGWQATMVVRDDFTPADADVASRADLLLVQPLRPEEAQLVGAALGLGETADWLTRIRADMLAVINRRAVRWAVLSQTSIEAQLIGTPVRG